MKSAGVLPFVCLSLAIAQQPESAGSIEGRVINSKTGEPIRKALVTLNPGVPTGLFNDQTVSDTNGHYRFEHLPAGRYQVNAQHPRYAIPSSIARPKELELSTNQDLTGVTLKLTPPGVLGGHVFDEDGDPMPATMVQAFTVSMSGPHMAGAAPTDENGQFRISGLPAGHYIVATFAPREFWGQVRLRPGKPREAYLRSYYPAEAGPATALPIDLAAGQAVSSVNIHLQKSKVFRVTGKVTPFDANCAVMLRPRRDNFEPIRAITDVGEDRKFEFTDALPGAYTLWVQAEKTFGRVDIEVVDHDIEGVTIALAAGRTISGKVVVEKESDLPKLKGLQVQTWPTSGFGGGQTLAPVKDQAFQVEGMGPGLYRYDLNARDDLWVKSASFNGQEFFTEFDYDGNVAAELVITVSSEFGSVEVSAQDSDGNPASGALAVLLPDPYDPRRRDSIDWQSTDPRGLVSFKKVRPGTYRLFVWTGSDEAFGDPAAFEPVKEKGQKIEVTAKGPQRVTAPLISVSEAVK